LDYVSSTTPRIPWQHHDEDPRASSLRSSGKKPLSFSKETNLTYLDAHDRGAVIEEIKEETDVREK